MHALGSWCERYRSGTGARQRDCSGLWIKTRSALRLYFARSAPRSLHAPLRSHALDQMMSERSHHHHPATHPRSRPMSARRKAPSLTHQPDPPASPTSSFPSVPRQPWVLNRRKQTAAPPYSKRETDERLSHRKKLTVHAYCPLEDITCVLLAQTKDAKIVCVIRCQITRTRMHTSLKRLASARHSNSRKSFLPVECTLQTKQSLKTKKMDDVFSRRPFILWSRR